MHRTIEGLKTWHGNMQLCGSSYSKQLWGEYEAVEQHSLRLSAFSLVITQVWISLNFLHRMWRASAGLLTTNARGRWEQAACAETNTLTKHFPRFHNTVLQYRVTVETRLGEAVWRVTARVWLDKRGVLMAVLHRLNYMLSHIRQSHTLELR